MSKEDPYGIQNLFDTLNLESTDFDTPSAQVLRKRAKPLGLSERSDEIPITIEEADPEAINDWLSSRTTPDVGRNSTIYEDLYEISISIAPLLKIAKQLPANMDNNAVLMSIGDSEIRVKDLKRLRNVEMRIRLLRMAIQQLEARISSTTDPGFWKK